MSLPSAPRRLAFFAVPALALTACVFIVLDPKAVFEPPWLLPLLNTVFLSAALFVIAYIAGRGYRASGAVHLLFFGSAVLTFGAGSLVAGWVIGAHGSTDAAVTLHNTAAAVGGDAAPRQRAPRDERGPVPGVRPWSTPSAACDVCRRDGSAHPPGRRESPRLDATLLYPWYRFTPLRQVTLGIAGTAFVASGLLFAGRYRAVRSDFLYWSASALGLVAVGLGALFFQRAVGSPVGWIGRSAQYLGCLFLLVAAMHAVREVRRRRLPLDRAVAALFHEARENYQALVEAVADPIVAFDQDGSVLLWNTAAERTFGYTRDEAFGAPLIDLIGLRGESVDWVTGKRFGRDGWAAVALGTRLQTEAQRKDGTTLPVEISLSWRQGGGGFVGTTILRDVTDRQRAMERLARLNRHLRTISLCNQALVRAQKESELLRETCRIIVEEGAHRVTWVGFLEETGDRVRPVAVVGCDPARLDSHAINLADAAWATCPVALTLRTGMPQVVRDIPGNPPRCPWRMHCAWESVRPSRCRSRRKTAPLAS
jgi:PAS domain S-box-containing protein